MPTQYEKAGPAVGAAGIRTRIDSFQKGKVFSPVSFYDLGTRAVVDMTLSRLRESNYIRRVARGLYDKPCISTLLGPLTPATEAIKEALEEKYKYRLKYTGAMAANLMKLSDQIPARITFLTDGPTGTFEVMKNKVAVKHASPKRMASSGKAGLIMEALRYIGQSNIIESHLETLKKDLSPEERISLQDQLPFAPGWMQPHLKKVMAQFSETSRKNLT